jgi:hypothetical protein
MTPFPSTLAVAVGADYLTLTYFFENPFDGPSLSRTSGNTSMFGTTNVVKVHHMGRIPNSTIGTRHILQRVDKLSPFSPSPALLFCGA